MLTFLKAAMAVMLPATSASATRGTSPRHEPAARARGTSPRHEPAAGGQPEEQLPFAC
ncbi:hypothetical protein [Sphaerisporangium aureirubrum]|uniref:Uncharacterized protein n=1 Tax=Sphaerisporangium aureirubrum TaxID=1544736 RepID=A0ABW1NIZ0_9ACTN